MINSGRSMLIARGWAQAAIITFAAGFVVLGYLAYSIKAECPPIPVQVTDPAGQILFTADDVRQGQEVFQKFALMQHGSIFGHGAYLGPDFTAQYLHQGALLMQDYYRSAGADAAEARVRTETELKQNRLGPDGNLAFTAGQAAAYRGMVDFYRAWFGLAADQKGLKRPAITDVHEVRRLTSFFSWAAWTASAARPGKPYSYTNNWPPEPLAGNTPTAQSLVWSAMSIMALLGGAGIVFFAFGRYTGLGWKRADSTGDRLHFREPETVRLTPAQRATAWYFLVVAGLFLAQGMLGGANAHYHVDPQSFYGLDLAAILPYNVSRMWHVQLALFFVVSSFLAMGIFLAPLVAGVEPPHQEKLALLLFGALVVVAVGSLLGEWLSVKDFITRPGPWFWLGTQGWEYLDLGRVWQAALLLGLLLWAVIIMRGLWSTLRHEHPGNLPWLFVYSAFSIPLFYAAGMVFWKGAEFAVMDFWRFWVVHLWVEDFLELFTTIMVAVIFVLLGVVRREVATTVIYLDIILYSVGGVIGTMHHLYFSGAPAQHMAFGAFFSAMEVIPLVLLSYEAWRFIQLGSASRGKSAFQSNPGEFPHKWAVMFLIAVGFWNFLGAGVFGFLINLPIVSYWEIGTQFTANHSHGALMGVYGMLAIGFFMFVARYFLPAERTDRLMRVSFWSLNLGLLWMVLVNLIPLGIVQLYDSVLNGYWHARSPEFFGSNVVRVLEWLRLPGDVLFIVGGIGPVAWLALLVFLKRKRPGSVGPGEECDPLLVD